MAHLQLRIYNDPSEDQLFCNLLRRDGDYETLTVTVDTGAAVSLFPIELLDVVVSRPIGRDTVIIDQAGVASQFFEAAEAFVTISLEDEFGSTTQFFDIPAWCANSDTPLLGFAGALDRAVLHLDMPHLNGWLEI